MSNEINKIATILNKHDKIQTLMHYINISTLEEQHKKEKIGKAKGVDNVTKQEYEENLKENLRKLIDRMKSFEYKPQPVRRVYIPKVGSDKLRPLGIPAYEDKLVQGVMANVLTEIYENKFYELSYGFRPKRSCHDAIEKLRDIIIRKEINYIVDADIKGFFDNVNHEWMMRFLEHDIQDKNFLRYIKRFLNAGIMDKGEIQESDKGTPQGGLISPVLANIYLHYVLDDWFNKVVKVKCKGDAEIVRYADDFVCCFENEKEAIEFYRALIKRLEKFGLEIAEEKSKIIKFGRNNKGKKNNFDFLGFTFIEGKSRNNKFIVITKTSKKKLKAKKQAVKMWLKENIYVRTDELIKRLNTKLRGHYNYYGVPNNGNKIQEFYLYVVRQLYSQLRRRGQKHRLNYETFNRMLEYCPILSPYIHVKCKYGKGLL